jgi:hypothetical protein
MRAGGTTGWFAVHDVEIVPMSARDELIHVMRAAMAIAAGVWLYVTNNPFPVSSNAVQRSLLPFQAIVATLPSESQSMFRELQVSLLEAETIRSAEGAWPDAVRLKADLVEPFSPNPALKGAAYEWALLRDRLIVDYLGRPQRAAAPAWLVRVMEPDPSLPPEAFVEDEEHDRLLDGSVLHVSIWTHPEGNAVPARVGALPQAEGWIQVYAADPAGIK